MVLLDKASADHWSAEGSEEEGNTWVNHEGTAPPLLPVSVAVGAEPAWSGWRRMVGGPGRIQLQPNMAATSKERGRKKQNETQLASLLRSATTATQYVASLNEAMEERRTGNLVPSRSGTPPVASPTAPWPRGARRAAGFGRDGADAAVQQQRPSTGNGVHKPAPPCQQASTKLVKF